MSKTISIFIAFTLIAITPMQASAQHGDATSRETQIQQVITTLEEETRRLADVCVLTSVGESKPECEVHEYILDIESSDANGAGDVAVDYLSSDYFSDYIVEFADGGAVPYAVIAAPASIAELIGAFPGIGSISPNKKVQSNQDMTLTMELDWDVELPWNLDRISSPQTADNLFIPASTGAGTYIYVVDTGVYSHNDFGDRILEGYSTRQDGKGYTDCNGHGTHVASIASGSEFGIAREAQIIPVRALDCAGGGDTSDILSSLNWVYEHVQTHDYPSIVNLSLNGKASRGIERALDMLVELDVALVGAIGNTANPECSGMLLSQTPSAILVGSSNGSNSFSASSSYGTCMDVIAPGDIVEAASISGPNDSVTRSGTSMAAPHVSGILATLLTGLTRDATYTVIERMLDMAIPDIINGVPKGTPNKFVLSPSPKELPLFQEGLEFLGAESPIDSPAELSEIPVERQYINGALHLSWNIENESEDISQQELVFSSLTPEDISYGVEMGNANKIRLERSARSYILDLSEYDSEDISIEVFALDSEGNQIARSLIIPLNKNLELIPRTPIPSPNAGELNVWTKRVSDTEVKFYAKYPQVGQKIQFMVQDPSGQYKEHAWLRIEPEDIDSDGAYPEEPLTNGVYFVRTLDLKPGKNRLRILVNGELQDRTITYVR